jgi:hypothetical protein
MSEEWTVFSILHALCFILHCPEIVRETEHP